MRFVRRIRRRSRCWRKGHEYVEQMKAGGGTVRRCLRCGTTEGDGEGR